MQIDDEKWMRVCIDLARQAARQDEVPVGAVINAARMEFTVELPLARLERVLGADLLAQLLAPQPDETTGAADNTTPDQ